MSDIELGPEDLEEAAESLKNWSRWGPDDEIGTLNHTTPETWSQPPAWCARARSSRSP